ncbi:MAG: flagellar hook-length control protein FliK [Pusillimonas sp.]|nr:flagellar hook-length control protein FliK [Pusillimonas sp.]
MNAPTPVSALNILARPEKSVSPQGSANGSGTSFYSALEQQKRTLAEREKQANAVPETQAGKGNPENKTFEERGTQTGKNEQQESGRLAQNDNTENRAESKTESNDKHAESRNRHETEGALVTSSTEAKTSLDVLVHGLPLQANRNVVNTETASNLPRHRETNLAAIENAANPRVFVNDTFADRPDPRSDKTRQIKLPAPAEISSSANVALAPSQSGKETELLNIQTAGPLAGAAITKTSGRTSSAQSERLNNQFGSDRPKGIRLERTETTLSQPENSSTFLDRVVEARRISGQQFQQNTSNEEIAIADAGRKPGGPEPASAPFFTSPQNAVLPPIWATVSTPVGHAQWGREFSQQISSFSQHIKSGLQTIELRLDPPDLGPIRISLSLSDNVAQASFVSPHATVRQAVEQALPQLQEQLAQAGISLGQTSVGEQHQQGAQHAAMQHPKAGVSLNEINDTDDAALPQVKTGRAHNGQVDTFA